MRVLTLSLHPPSGVTPPQLSPRPAARERPEGGRARGRREEAARGRGGRAPARGRGAGDVDVDGADCLGSRSRATTSSANFVSNYASSRGPNPPRGGRTGDFWGGRSVPGLVRLVNTPPVSRSPPPTPQGVRPPPGPGLQWPIMHHLLDGDVVVSRKVWRLRVAGAPGVWEDAKGPRLPRQAPGDLTPPRKLRRRGKVHPARAAAAEMPSHNTDRQTIDTPLHTAPSLYSSTFLTPLPFLQTRSTLLP